VVSEVGDTSESLPALQIGKLESAKETEGSMTATKEEVTPAVEQVTDDAIKRECDKLSRMILKRQEDVCELRHEITVLESRRDELINVQIARLKAQMSQLNIEGE
jgi:hypothetical protein